MRDATIFHQIEDIYYPVLLAVGIPGNTLLFGVVFMLGMSISIVLVSFLFVSVNLMAILILSQGKCGLSRCITFYLVAMATADLMIVFTDVLLYTVIPFHFPGTYMDTTLATSLTLVLLSAATDISVWFTVTFTFDRFVAICCQKLRTRYCTVKTATVVLTTVSVTFSLKNIPWYFIYEPEYIVDNVPWGWVVSSTFYTETAWLAFDCLSIILTPFVPFILILLLNTLTVRHIIVTGRVWRRLQQCSGNEEHIDPEMEKRRKSIVLLFTITGSFVLLWTTNVGFFLYWRTANVYVSNGVHDPNYITKQTGYMLQLLTSCTNTCIYVVTQAKFREQLKNVLMRPFSALAAWFK